MTTWVEALRASGGRSPDMGAEDYLAPSTWLAAAMLDWQGYGAEHVLDGVLLLVVPSAPLRDGIEALVALVFGRNASWSGDLSARGDLLVVRNPRSTKDWALTVSRKGCPALVLAADGSDIVAPSSLAAVDDVLHVLGNVQREVLATAAHGVTGGRPALPVDMFTVTVDEALAVLHAGDDPEDVERRLGTLLAARQAPAAEDEEPEDKGHGKPPAVKPRVPKLSELTGFGDAAAWGMSLAEDLRAYASGKLAWADVDRGILLSGPPGSGKTTFASALAAECGVDLVPTTYAEWSAAGGSSGDSMSKGMTKLFDGWRKKAAKGPFILFVDEIDTMGRRGGNDHNESWFSSVINSWLAFLDGAIPRDGIVVVAATNHPDRVDPALLRPGRLDRAVELPYPGVEALAGVVRHHLGPGADCPEADLVKAARACRGMSPAAVAQVCREARRVARKMFKRPVSADDVVLVLGAQRLEALQRPGAKDLDRRIAIHEAGHAVALLSGGGGDMLACVDMESATTWSDAPPVLDLAVVERRLTVLLAGAAAEQTLLGAHSAGVARDLRDATLLATSAQAAWGMGVLGYRVLGGEEAMGSAEVTRAVDMILEAAHARATALVEGSREAVLRLAGALQERRYLDAAEVRAVVDDPRPAPPRTGYGDRVARVVGPRRGRREEPAP